MRRSRSSCGIVLALLVAVGCGTRRMPGPIPSPDGSMNVTTRIETRSHDSGAVGCVILEIRDQSGRIVHSENTRASDRMRWSVAWVGDDRIRLQSSDIGDRFWRKRPDGTWKIEPVP